MMEFSRFTSGEPVLANDKSLKQRHGVLFLFDENGNEWYQCQKLFSVNTVKVAYDTNGIIRSVAKDVSMLWPFELSVAEVSLDDKSDLIDSSGCWKYENGKIFKNEDSVFCGSKSDFEAARGELLDSALKNITLLHIKLMLKIPLNKEEDDSLHHWIGYMDTLSAMDSNDYKTLKLPGLPEMNV
jgi:hypothetical protein